MLEHIYFDWSGTLAYPKSRERLYKGDKTVLYNDTIKTLDYLYNKGYKIGIISNTKMSRDKFIIGLKKINVYKYFDKIVLSSDEGMCRKSCNLIFQSIKDNSANASANAKYIYVGNNLIKDIYGAKNNDFLGIHIKRDYYIYNLNEYHFEPDITIKELNELIDLL